MIFRPVDLMLDRVNRNGNDSDSVLFTEYLYAGELLCKLSVAAIVAAIQDDRQRYRYGLVHQLIRGDGIGEWAKVLDDALNGPASQHFISSLSYVRTIYTERQPKGSWAHEATKLLLEIVAEIKGEQPQIPEKIAFKSWFVAFAELRNKTRGHGATTPAAASRYSSKISESIRIVCENNPVFKLSWAYLHRNISGKYRVIPLGGDQSVFSFLKSASAIDGKTYRSGIYFHAEQLIFVEILLSDNDAQDFFLPNGGFSASSLSYELLSLISDSRQKGDATEYSLSPGERPSSETEGAVNFQALNNTLTNAPSKIKDYVQRPALEDEVYNIIMNDRHPIVTLVGRGGVGKTSLALSVLERLSLSKRYDAVIWFSARDIDLMSSGAKPVQPRVLTEGDISKQYISLISEFSDLRPDEIKNAVVTMASHLRTCPLGNVLFIFDNFETVRSPIDLFNWIDTNIRLPNKAVITSRFREFKADYPIVIGGMEQIEAVELIDGTASKLGISKLLNATRIEEIYDTSNGHPYIMKIVLGEIADAGQYSKPSNLIARKDDILDALFERTFANLAPTSARIFLTLSGWRSSVPRLALEAVLLRHGSDISNPEASIDQLIRMSLVESNVDDQGYEILGIPLSAALFAKRKLQVSPFRSVIEADTKFLQDIGAVTTQGARVSIRPQIETFFRKTARKISDGSLTFEEIAPILEFLSHGFPDAWILLSSMTAEAGIIDGNEKSMEYLRRYLELNPDGSHAATAWDKLVYYYKSSGDFIAALGAFVQFSNLATPPVEQVSDMANMLNIGVSSLSGLELAERHALLRPLILMLEKNLKILSATDMSRLAWLHLHSGNPSRAREVAQEGNMRDAENTHCRRILARLSE